MYVTLGDVVPLDVICELPLANNVQRVEIGARTMVYHEARLVCSEQKQNLHTCYQTRFLYSHILVSDNKTLTGDDGGQLTRD